MEANEKLEQSEISKNKGTEFFKVTIFIMRTARASSRLHPDLVGFNDVID